MSARWIALVCIFAWFTIMGVIAIFNLTPNVPPFIIGGLQLVGGVAGLISLFISGRSKD